MIPVVAFLSILALITSFSQPSPAGAKDPVVVLTLTAVCDAHAVGSMEDGYWKFDDKVTVTLREQNEYRIVEIPSNGMVKLELISHTNSLSVEGGGDIINDVDPHKWTYTIKNRTSTPTTGLRLHYGEGKCRVSLIDFIGVAGLKHTDPVHGGFAGGIASLCVIEAVNTTPSNKTGFHDQMCSTFEPWPRRLAVKGHAHHHYDRSSQEINSTSRQMGNLQVEYSVTMGGDGESEVELHDMAPAWLPEEGGHVFGTMLVKGAKEAESFRFTLYDVSSEPGDCCNSPDDNTRPDLCFAENQEGWSIRQEGDKWVATSAEGGKTASIRINCLDWGAWGKLKGEALIQGQRKQARVDGGSDFIRIPYDQNDDHIADFWQKKKGVFDKPATDDSDGEYTGHAILGDGLSVYEEYRGFYIGSAADLTYVRLDPKQQQLFVLDRTGYFDPERAGIAHLEVYMLSEGLCEEGTSADASGIVNFRSSYARNGVKYCAVLTDAVGSGKDPELGETTWPNHGLRDVQYCRVFSRNAKEGLTLLANKVHYALRDPESQPAREFAAMGISRRVLQLADTQFWDEANRSEWSGSLLRWAALQQVLTACAVPTHAPGATTSPCFMKFRARWPDITLPLLQAMTDRRLRPDKMDYLCGRDAINCQGHVNVKDN